MTFGSLFTGAGGMDLGLERAGMTCRIIQVIHFQGISGEDVGMQLGISKVRVYGREVQRKAVQGAS